jgi:citrate lyase subunit beta/citryl-CoA lyase
MRKAVALGADSIVFDLEDAVAPASKAAARAAVAEAVREATEAARRPEVCVRVNPPRTGFHADDVRAVAKMAPDAVVVPKAERADDIAAVASALRPGTPVIVLIETARGLLAAESIARVEGVEALVFGSEDFAASAGLVRSKSNVELLVPRSTVAIVAAAYGRTAIDQVYVDYQDAPGLERESREGRALGYRGKQIIHPSQIEPVHRAFSPSKPDAEAALRLLEAAEKAGIGEGGVFAYEGRMVDRPLVEQARQTVALARHAGIL